MEKNCPKLFSIIPVIRENLQDEENFHLAFI